MTINYICPDDPLPQILVSMGSPNITFDIASPDPVEYELDQIALLPISPSSTQCIYISNNFHLHEYVETSLDVLSGTWYSLEWINNDKNKLTLTALDPTDPIGLD